MASTKIEYLVQMTCDSCVNAVRKSLENVDGVKTVDINLETGSVVVDSNLSTLDIQKKIESTGRKVAVRGYSGSLAGVTILEALNKHLQGVVRFIQVTPDTCILDGTIDGLQPGTYHLSVHEYGDISEGCQSVGDIYNPSSETSSRIYGDLGTVKADKGGRAAFRVEDNYVKLSKVIGRSLVISMQNQEKHHPIACGIIARSAGLFQNPKTICACDGVTIWDEVSKPKSSL